MTGKDNLTMFMLGSEIAELMQGLGYDRVENQDNIIFQNIKEPLDRKRVIIGINTGITCLVWNDNHGEERWHQVFKADLPSYRYARLSLINWAFILHIGQQVPIAEILKLSGLKIAENGTVNA
jgi:hypothetical protein